MVRLLALGDEHIQTCLIGGELGTQIFDRHILRFLDNPEVENLGLNNQVVCITHFLLNSCDILAGEARNDTVYQRCANVVVFLKPLLEALVICTHIFFPEFDIFADAIFQVVSVQEYQLARHQDKSLGRAAVEGLITTEKQLNQLAGITAGRSV